MQDDTGAKRRRGLFRRSGPVDEFEQERPLDNLDLAVEDPAEEAEPVTPRRTPKRTADMFAPKQKWTDTWSDDAWDDAWKEPAMRRTSIPPAADPTPKQVDEWLESDARAWEDVTRNTVRKLGGDPTLAARVTQPGSTWDDTGEVDRPRPTRPAESSATPEAAPARQPVDPDLEHALERALTPDVQPTAVATTAPTAPPNVPTAGVSRRFSRERTQITIPAALVEPVSDGAPAAASGENAPAVVTDSPPTDTRVEAETATSAKPSVTSAKLAPQPESKLESKPQDEIVVDLVETTRPTAALTSPPTTPRSLTDAVPKSEAPKVDAPKSDTPKAEAPKAESPKAEAPKAEAPKAEAPKAEAPKAEAPKAESPTVPTAPSPATVIPTGSTGQAVTTVEADADTTNQLTEAQDEEEEIEMDRDRAAAFVDRASWIGTGVALIAGVRLFAHVASSLRQGDPAEGSLSWLNRFGDGFAKAGALHGLLLIAAVALLSLPALFGRDDFVPRRTGSGLGLVLGGALIGVIGAVVGLLSQGSVAKAFDQVVSWGARGDMLAALGLCIVALGAAMRTIRSYEY
jgi:hypothetical protein